MSFHYYYAQNCELIHSGGDVCVRFRQHALIVNVYIRRCASREANIIYGILLEVRRFFEEKTNNLF